MINYLLQLVEPRWHGDFQTFIETGEAPDEFLVFLNQDKNAQKAVDIAFNAQAAAFENFAKALTEKPAENDDETRRNTVTANVAIALEGAIGLSPTDRTEAFQRAATVLKASLKEVQPGQKTVLAKNGLNSAIKDLQEALASSH
jgi:U3 small nucleolar RNA-associated protein 14